MTDDTSRHDCPACGSIETEQVELTFARVGDSVEEIRSCNDCYAGYTVTYEPADKELTTEPEAI